MSTEDKYRIFARMASAILLAPGSPIAFLHTVPYTPRGYLKFSITYEHTAQTQNCTLKTHTHIYTCSTYMQKLTSRRLGCFFIKLPTYFICESFREFLITLTLCKCLDVNNTETKRLKHPL